MTHPKEAKPSETGLRPAVPSSGPRPTPALMKLCEVLEDGRWHPVDKVIRIVGKAIPPGQAMRRVEHRRRAMGGPEERVKLLDTSRQIDSGRRNILKEMLNQKTFESSMVDGVRMVRMTQLPNRVYYERSRILAETLKPETLTESLRTGDLKTMMGALTYDQLLAVAIEMAQRLRIHGGG